MTQTLERSDPFTNFAEVMKYLPSGSSNWVTASTAYRTVKSAHYRTEKTNTPNYYQLLAAGKLIPHTPFAQFNRAMVSGSDNPVFDGRYEFTDTVPNPDRYYAFANGWAANLNLATSTTCNLDPFGLTSDEVDEIVRSRANGAFTFLPQQAAANLAQSGFDATTFMAEIFSTRRLFMRTADTAVQAFKQFNRLKRRASRMNYDDWLRSISDAWLTGRYGFRPLAYDIRDLSELVEKTFGESQEKKYQSARAGLSEVGEWAHYRTSSSSFWTTDITYRDQITYDLSFRGSVTSDLIGGLTNVDNNLLVTAWELIPFSFVIDWFVNVGTAIAVQEFLLKSRQWTASYGYKITGSVRRHIHVAPAPRSGVTIHYMIPPSNSLSFERVVRIPTTVSNLPTWRVRLDPAKTADAAALVHSYFTRKRR